MTINELWNTFPVEEKKVYRLQLGNLNLWIERRNRDWLFAKEYDSLDEPTLPNFQIAEQEPSASLEWQRWAFEEEVTSIRFAPCMPDRLLMVHTSTPTFLLPGVKTTFWLQIPIFIAVSLGEKESFELEQVPSIRLSDSWLGDYFKGILCYGLQSRAFRENEKFELAPHNAVCPFSIENQDDSSLPIKFICVAPKQLHLYGGHQFLWTNQVTVTLSGKDQEPQLQYSPNPPDAVEAPTLLRQAEQKRMSSSLWHALTKYVQ